MRVTVTPSSSEAHCMREKRETPDRRNVTGATKRKAVPEGRLNKQLEHLFESPYDMMIQTA